MEIFPSSGWIFEARAKPPRRHSLFHASLFLHPHVEDQSIMAGQGASLQNFNNELVKCIEDLREKRDEINRQLLKDEEDKAKIQRDLNVLTDRLLKINESLARKVTARNEYDRTIQETEGAYMKILESSATLLQVLKRETVTLVKKKT
jgi:Sjoegren syndrome nuclear autoantigen 1